MNNKPHEELLKYPQEIECVIQHLKNKYNGPESYLKSIGVPPEVIEKIYRRMVCQPGLL